MGASEDGYNRGWGKGGFQERLGELGEHGPELIDLQDSINGLAADVERGAFRQTYTCGVPTPEAMRDMGYVTKDSGQRAEYPSGMVRDTDKGKPRFDLLLPLGIPYEQQMLTRFAALMARGAEKYDERNWEQANSPAEVERMKSSALRHMMQWLAGETDEDHAAAVFFNIMAAEATAYKMATMAQDGRM